MFQKLLSFSPIPRVATFETLESVGLGLKLGQSALTLSGGEAKGKNGLNFQNRTERPYVLDDQTTGLHFADVQKLMEVLNAS